MLYAYRVLIGFPKYGRTPIEKNTLFHRSLLFHNLHHLIQRHFAAFSSKGAPVASVNLPVPPSTNAVINTAWLPEGMYFLFLNVWCIGGNKQLFVHVKVLKAITGG